MAPPGEKSVAESQKRPISTILLVMAMQSEALPVVNKLNLTENPGSIFPEGVNWVRYHGFYKDLDIHLVWPGKDSALGFFRGRYSIGTVPASLLTYACIQALHPDIIINAGTAGGFKAQGARVGDVYLASDVAFCDRRISISREKEIKSYGKTFTSFRQLMCSIGITVQVFDLYGLGMRKSFPTPNLQKELHLKVGRLSTGDSMHMSPQDEATMVANDATIKDMEGAAVAYVADLLRVPTIFVKSVIVQKDGDKPTAEGSLQCLTALERAVTQVIDFISGKCLSDL